MSPQTISIEERFRGPPRSANGGYACGRIAAFIDGIAQVSLWRPPPLDKPMDVVKTKKGVEVYDDDKLIASGSSSDVNAAADVRLPSFTDALAATSRTFPAERHTLPSCFVCGPLRDRDDGLHIHPGPVDEDDADWERMLAAPWIPAADLADKRGIVLPEFVWAALDCPTAYAAGTSDGLAAMLLGRQTVRIERRPAMGERCIVASWATGIDGRKHYADSMLIGEKGEPIAFCNAVWIEVSREVQRGDATH
jgi:hypothetical protein